MPEKMFPIAVFHDDEDGRIIMTNSSKECGDWVGELRDNDIIFFTDAWHIFTPDTALNILNNAVVPENMYFFCNDYDSLFIRVRHGVTNCFLLHKNSWIDNSRFRILDDQTQKYDAVYNARLAPFKRHYLANRVGHSRSLALVCGQHSRGSRSLVDIPPHEFINEWHLPPNRVCEILNSSRVALALSEAEGGCFASTEYLLCGLPVVSTASNGGRDYWYNQWNSLVVDDDEDAVLQGVDHFLKNPPDRQRIRQQAVDQQRLARRLFVEQILAPALAKLNSPRDAREVFESVDLHKYGAFRGQIWRNISEVREIIQAPPGQAAEWSRRVHEARVAPR